MSESSPSIMAALKAATAELHTMAERRELQHQMASGTIPRELYVAYLGQMFLVHRTLEACIRRRMSAHRAFAAVVREYHWREPQLREDLAFFKTDPESVEPVPAARALMQAIEHTSRDEPVALLGMLYVLEGSTNGAKFIVASLIRRQGLQRGPGLTYLDPHGDLQKERWQAFKRDMNAVSFTEAESGAIIETARAVFRSVAELSDELIEPVAA